MDATEFRKADAADRPVYLDRAGRAWVFYKIGLDVGSWYFPPFADNNPVQLVVGFYEGMKEAEKLIRHKTVFWLTPEQFFYEGGKLRT